MREGQHEGRLARSGGGEVARPRTPPQAGEWDFQDIAELVTKYGQVKLRYEALQEEHKAEKQALQVRHPGRRRRLRGPAWPQEMPRGGHSRGIRPTQDLLWTVARRKLESRVFC